MQGTGDGRFRPLSPFHALNTSKTKNLEVASGLKEPLQINQFPKWTQSNVFNSYEFPVW